MKDTTSRRDTDRGPGRDFIRAIIDEDLRAGVHDRVVTRFPPEPNGFLHIGHAKAICLNFGIAEEYGGVCHLRFDDTNPTTEDVKYVEAIQEDVRWLGFDWGEHLYFASDYFEEMYRLAVELIRKGLAYVDSQSEDEIREGRGTISEPGRASPHRDRSPDENLDLFRRMRDGQFPDGAHVLRAKIHMASPNMLLRDPVLYRIRHASHYRTGDAWCIYPLYDFAHPLEDALECITHSLCTLEFENNRPLYDWVVENTSVPCRPRQYEFARLNLDYTVMSKRKLLDLVRRGHVDGWDDPRMPTIAGLRRRGFTPESIRAFADMVGVAKTESRVDMAKLEFAVRDDLNRRAPRVLCVLRPLRVVLLNYPEGEVERLDAPSWPHDVPREGSRPVPFSRTLFIERDDFMEDPPPGFHRLAPGREVRLRYGYIIRCEEVVKDQSGEIIELRCTYDPATRGGAAPDGRPVKGTIHWVSAEHSLPCRVRLYDRLFSVPDPDAAAADEGSDFKAFVNPGSLVEVDGARIEPNVEDDPPGSRYQFERLGYFIADPHDSRPGRPVYNRTVTLRDAWAKAAARAAGGGGARGAAVGPGDGARGSPAASAGSEGAPAIGTAAREPGRRTEARAEVREAAGSGSPPAGSGDAAERAERFERELNLSAAEATLLARDAATAELADAALAAGAPAKPLANWLINELPRETKERAGAELPFGGAELAELIALVEDGTLSSSAGREVLAELVRAGGRPSEIVERKGLRQIRDPAELAPAVEAVLRAEPAKVQEYRDGRVGLLGFFTGQVMRRTGGRADPEQVQRLLRERLEA